MIVSRLLDANGKVYVIYLLKYVNTKDIFLLLVVTWIGTVSHKRCEILSCNNIKLQRITIIGMSSNLTNARFDNKILVE